MATNQTSLIMCISNCRLTNRPREPYFGTQGVHWDRNLSSIMWHDQTSFIMRKSNSRLTNRVRGLPFGTHSTTSPETRHCCYAAIFIIRVSRPHLETLLKLFCFLFFLLGFRDHISKPSWNCSVFYSFFSFSYSFHPAKRACHLNTDAPRDFKFAP